jgi:hypothetical protein
MAQSARRGARTRQGGDSRKTINRPGGKSSPAAVQRALAFAARERFVRSKAARDAWKRRKLAAIEEISARRKAEEVKGEIEKERAQKVEEAKERFVERAQEAAEIRKRKKLRPLEREQLKREVEAAAQQIEFAQVPGAEERVAERDRILSEIKLGRELLSERVEKFYEIQKAAGKVMPLSPKHLPGRTWRHRSEFRVGYVLDRKESKLLNRENFEDIVERITATAEKASEKQPLGKLYMSFSFFEYGRGIPKSSHRIVGDEFGDYWQSFDGTGALSPAGSIDEFEGKVREMLLDRLSKYGENHVVLLDGFQVKAFYNRTPEEQAEYRRQKALKKGK